MIDVENLIFDRLADIVRTVSPSAAVYGEYVEAPAAFPCVTIVEADNRVLERTRDLDAIEHYAQIMYEVNVYTNDSSGKKSKAKSIANAIDNEMLAMHFTRSFRGQTPNIDRTIYRITMRFSAIVREAQSENGKLVYHLYSTK